MFKQKKMINFQIKSAVAARAIYQEGRDRVPKISLTFESEEGEKIEFELQLDTAADFIDQAVAAYNSAMRPLKNQRG